ncbi:hypothetical protein NEICINOT_04528 [Neisseria cinerea ATCC 14685]|uniref:Uncharacterized protein n=1 Tax=Neisseria cinerea ATCC 14685 TaxID=546262 RepID=D0W4D1_NEICI|nr:hypothetical protein NEICINOT_04528 [Neisseria cinerea ATCC 14685]
MLPPESGKNGKNHCPERRGWSGLCGSVMRLYRYRSADLFSAGVPVRLPENSGCIANGVFQVALMARIWR